MLLDAPAVQATLMKFENVRNGEAAGVILRVLVETPGVNPVRRGVAGDGWLVSWGGPESGWRSGWSGGLQHLEDSGRIPRRTLPTFLSEVRRWLAMGNKKMQAVLASRVRGRWCEPDKSRGLVREIRQPQTWLASGVEGEVSVRLTVREAPRGDAP